MHVVPSLSNTERPIRDLSKPRETAPPRMRPLATIPVFFGLTGKRAIVIGGSPAAGWKAELLAAAGAAVHVFAETLADEFEAVVARETVAGSLVHHPYTWTGDCLHGAAVVVADVKNADEAQAIVGAARAAGVPVNIIDLPAFCDFQFGSIVNRSPVVIGISTDGAAPILGQAIRRRIETLLPPTMADWARIAKELRGRVTARLKPGTERRTFWERFSEKAFGQAPSPREDEVLLDDARRITALVPTRGGVTLVGAGPGDAELLTLKAVRALQAADVILFDDLVSDEVLELARREARRMLVGKRGGRASCRQEDINATMVSLALAGKRVVRLKSGDPMIFGRAGEEIAELETHGIDVEIVPGITSALAMASAFGVSLTHRDHARSVRFVTAHSRQGRLPDDLDWQGIADPRTTKVFYMGGRTAGGIAARLIAEGMDGSTPAAIAAALSRPDERLWRGTLAGLTQAVIEIGLDQPVLIGIGQVFAVSAVADTHGAVAAEARSVVPILKPSLTG